MLVDLEQAGRVHAFIVAIWIELDLHALTIALNPFKKIRERENRVLTAEKGFPVARGLQGVATGVKDVVPVWHLNACARQNAKTRRDDEPFSDILNYNRCKIQGIYAVSVAGRFVDVFQRYFSFIELAFLGFDGFLVGFGRFGFHFFLSEQEFGTGFLHRLFKHAPFYNLPSALVERNLIRGTPALRNQPFDQTVRYFDGIIQFNATLALIDHILKFVPANIAPVIPRNASIFRVNHC